MVDWIVTYMGASFPFFSDPVQRTHTYLNSFSAKDNDSSIRSRRSNASSLKYFSVCVWISTTVELLMFFFLFFGLLNS